MKMLKTLAVALIAGLALGSLASAQKWQNLKNPPTFDTDTALLLTDGRAMVHEYNTSNWWALQPDNTGSYVNGTWKQLASMPSTYAPLYFASQVLHGGRVLVEGGEYNFLQGVETNLGAIYDPVKNKWTAVNPPKGWANIGDSPGVILPDRTFMMGMGGFSTTRVNAFFNPKTLTWTEKGKGKADGFVEEGMALLPNGKVILVDTQDVPNSEIFDPKTFKWSSAGSTKVI